MFNAINYESIKNVIVLLTTIITTGVAVIYFYQNFYAITGLLFKNKKYNKAKKLHNYGYIICAHDEEEVVGQLIDSINKQNYPKELMHVFVVADNCTDQTANIAKLHGATVFERFSEKKGKCYALDFAIHEIFDKYEELNIESFFIFDADNLVSKDFTLKMNDMYDSGIEVGCGFRNSKNYDDNWITAGSSMTFIREAELIHKSRARLNIGTYVSGTGFYVSKKILEKNGGWPFETLVEDIEFSLGCAMDKVKIGYCSDAEFFDEQPSTLKGVCNQRMRWCKGTHQCFYKYWLKLFVAIFKKRSIASFEMFAHVFPLPAISFMWTLFITIVMSIVAVIFKIPFNVYYQDCLSYIVNFYLIICGITTVQALIAYMHSYKRIKGNKVKIFFYTFTFAPFMALFLPLSSIALFKKVKWVKVPHTIGKTIDSLEEEQIKNVKQIEVKKA